MLLLFTFMWDLITTLYRQQNKGSLQMKENILLSVDTLWIWGSFGESVQTRIQNQAQWIAGPQTSHCFEPLQLYSSDFPETLGVQVTEKRGGERRKGILISHCSQGIMIHTVGILLYFISTTAVGRMYGDFHLTDDDWHVARVLVPFLETDSMVLRSETPESMRTWLKMWLPHSSSSLWVSHFSSEVKFLICKMGMTRVHTHPTGLRKMVFVTCPAESLAHSICLMNVCNSVSS